MKKIDYSKNKVINLDNVVEIGENIAVYTLQRLMTYRDNSNLFLMQAFRQKALRYGRRRKKKESNDYSRLHN